jgi:hypothetical protein
MELSQACIQHPRFPDIPRVQPEHGRQKADARLFIHHDLLKGKINPGFHQKI